MWHERLPSAEPPLPPPIAILAFDRPHYLKPVLESLLAQRGASLRQHRVFLFQDGARNRYSGAWRGDPAAIAEGIALFRALVPWGEVVPAGDNIGVAENVLRAERLVFEDLAEPIAWFFEDDLVLHPDYLRNLAHLSAMALAEEAIGYVSCVGDHVAPLAVQRARQGALVPMAMNWAFGLTRRHWQAMQPLLEPFHAAVLGQDYAARSTAAIIAACQAAGLPVHSSSQDNARRVATCVLGRNALNSVVVLGRYIGEAGLHMTPAMFRERRYDAARWLKRVEPAFICPDAAALAAMRAAVMAKQVERAAAAAARLFPAASAIPAPPARL